MGVGTATEDYLPSTIGGAAEGYELWLGYGGAASGYYDLLCVDAANCMESGGDSGAPILIWYLDDRAEIAGTHTAIRESERIFSPIEGIEADFGALGPVF